MALRREVRFAAVTQAVGERLVDEQLAELREAHHVHDMFTELSLEEAEPGEVLAAVERLAGAAVVLESAEHQVVDYGAGPADDTRAGSSTTGSGARAACARRPDELGPQQRLAGHPGRPA